MQIVKFSDIYLLSNVERAALHVRFAKDVTILSAGNGYGKSAILKSLYDAFGAEPHEVDESWRLAKVATLVHFSIDGTQYSILKVGSTVSVFNGDGSLRLTTTRVGAELTPHLSELFNFQLSMADQSGKPVSPPPAYIFAPYYIDQDGGWKQPWKSFDKMYLPRGAVSLAEYHSGIRSNLYYVAKAAKEEAGKALQAVEATIEAIRSALRQFRDAATPSVLSFNFEQFRAETDQLVAQCRHLQSDQAAYREKLRNLIHEQMLWKDQKSLIALALHESHDALALSVERPSEIDCPTCGHTYSNSIAERFELVKDEDGLLLALIEAEEHISALNVSMEKHRAAAGEIQRSVSEINLVLSARHSEVSFRDVVAQEGRNEAVRLLQERIDENTDHANRLRSIVAEMTKAMKDATSLERIKSIMKFYDEKLRAFAEIMDVRLDGASTQKITGISAGRGSEKPRGLLAYFYAFLHVARQFGSSSFCPIVIDAPNQQGQDDLHMPSVINFIISSRPPTAQTILAVENDFGIKGEGIEVIRVGDKKNHVLRPLEYEAISEHMKPYLAQMIS